MRLGRFGSDSDIPAVSRRAFSDFKSNAPAATTDKQGAPTKAHGVGSGGKGSSKPEPSYPDALIMAFLRSTK